MPITIRTYNRWAADGTFGARAPIELLDGRLASKAPQEPFQVFVRLRILDALIDRLPAGHHARSRAPVELAGGPDGDSVPEPEVSVVRDEPRDYRDRHPGPGDVLLVVQFASDRGDLDRKALRRFGWANIPAAWIVHLRDKTVEVYTGPSGPVDDPGYAEKATRGRDDSLEIRLDDGTLVRLPVADLLA